MHAPALLLDRIGKYVLMVIGLLLLVLTAHVVWSTKTWLAHAVQVEGTVIEMVREYDRKDNGVLFSPKVRFETVEGRSIVFQSSWKTNPPAYRAGQTVKVVYDRNEPHSAAIRGFLSLWMGPMILGFIGSIFFAIGTAIVVASNRVARGLGKPVAST